MPKNWRGKGRKGGGGGRGSNNTEKGHRGNWSLTPIPKENATMSAYYKAQQVVPDGDWDTFMESLKRPLPLTFRVTRHGQFSQLLRDRVHAMIVAAGESSSKRDITPIAWYPGDSAWKMAEMDRKTAKKDPQFADLHKFLVTETETGNISRQEEVSMLPPVVLDVKPHDTVLDMCAAPGSKTAQLIEMVHMDDTVEDMKHPRGLVVANDTNLKRAYMLFHQTKRLDSPCVVVTQYLAQAFPTISYRDPNASPDDDDSARQRQALYYDRVLADVPCSGDGTIRKNVDVWRDWESKAGLGLHKTQKQIALRGAALLKAGGRMVYSTCSFNPIEDEAVVAELLRECPWMHLVDASNLVPNLRSRPGLTTWKVPTKEFSADKPEWVEEPAQDGIFGQSSLFPPTPDVAEEMHLERCMRVLPHDQDTGGFFVAVLDKDQDAPTSRKVRGYSEAVPAGTEMPMRDQSGGQRFKEPPFRLFTSLLDINAQAGSGDPNVDDVAEFYGWSGPELRDLLNHFVVRTDEQPKQSKQAAAQPLVSRKKAGQCFACGQTGHQARMCQDATAKMQLEQQACFKCGQTGHLQRDCVGKDVRKRSGNEESGSIEEADAIEEAPAPKRPRVAPEGDKTEPDAANQMDETPCRTEPSVIEKVDAVEVPAKANADAPVQMDEVLGKTDPVGEAEERPEEKEVAEEPAVDKPPVTIFGSDSIYRKIYYVSEGVRHVLDYGEELMRQGKALRVVNSGLRVVDMTRPTRRNGEIHPIHRMSGEGAQYLLPHMSRRVVQITVDDLVCLLKSTNTNHLTYFDSFHENTKREVEEMSMGDIALVCGIPSTTSATRQDEGSSSESSNDLPSKSVILVGWLGRGSISLMESKARIFMLKNYYVGSDK